MTVYDSIPVTVTGGTLSDAEIAAYVKHSKKTYPNRNFERIRRITGYLVGTLDRFNDAKRAEVQDRVKHL